MLFRSPSQATDSSRQSTPASAKESSALAEAMDRLAASQQQQQNASASESGPPKNSDASSSSNSSSESSNNSAAAAALAEAARQRAMAHQQARAAGRLPGQSAASPPSPSANPSSAPSTAGIAPGGNHTEPLVSAAPTASLGNDNWAKLAPAVAKQLLEAQRDQVPSDYRAMVEQYFQIGRAHV